MQEKKVLAELPALTTLRVSNGALRGEKLPERIKIFNWGENPSIKGTFKAGSHTLEVLEANQRALGFERVAIDYNHCTVPGSPDYQAGKPPSVFGYGTVRAKENDGIWLEDVTWTPLGLEHARNFEDLSPAVAPGEGGEIEMIHSVALTTNGALKDVTFFCAKAARAIEAAGATVTAKAAEASGKNETKEDMSNNNSPGSGVLTLALLSSALGLAATATEADVTGKLQRLSALEPELVDLGNKVKGLEKLVAGNTPVDLTPLSSRIESLEKALQSNTDATVGRERSEIVALFASEGRVPKNVDGKAYTAEELGKLDLNTLKLLRANTPVTVPLHARGGRVSDDKNNGLKGLARTAAAFQAQFEEGRAD